MSEIRMNHPQKGKSGITGALSTRILAIVAMAASSLSQITVIPFDDVMWSPKDIIQVNMSEIFSGTSQSTVYTTTNGYIQDYTTKLGQRSLASYGFQNVDFVHFINNQTYAAIFDEKNIIVHTVSLDGLSIANELELNFSLPEPEASCSDLEFNSLVGRYYVVCFNDSTEENPGEFYLIELDSITGATITINKVPLTENQWANHTLKIVIATIDQGATTQRVLAIYDQGLSSTATDKNFWVAFFSGVDSGSNLKFEAILDLKANDYALTSFFDLFNYNNKLVLTGLQESKSIISMLSCSIDTSFQILDCSSPINTIVSYGYLGLMNTGQLVQLNLAKPNIYVQICDLVGPLEQKGWTNCKTVSQIDVIAGAYVTEVVGNQGIILVKYDFANGTYAGYTVYSNLIQSIGTEWTNTDPSQHAIVINQQVHSVQAVDSWIQWIAPPAVIFNTVGQAFQSGLTQLEVEATEPGSGTSASCIINVNVMKNVYSNVYYNESQLPEFNSYVDSNFEVFLSSDKIEGNDLTYSVAVDASIQDQVQSFTYDTQGVNVNYVFRLGVATFKQVTFFQSVAVAQDTNNKLLVFECEQPTVTSDVTCLEIVALTAQPNEILQERMFVAQDFPIFWTRANDATRIYTINLDDRSFSTIVLPGQADDVVVTALNLDGFILASFSSLGTIVNYHFTASNPHFPDILPNITKSNSTSEFFCPTTLYFCPHGANVLEVLSNCRSVPDVRMLKYTYWPGTQTFRLRNTLAINLALADGTFCPMGGEFIFSSVQSNVVYGAATYFEVANYSYSLDELNIGTITKVDCVPTLSMFTIISTDAQNNIILSIFKGNNQYQANNKVYNVVPGMNAGVASITNHNFMGNMIHVRTMTAGGFSYLLTNFQPVINVRVFDSVAAGTYNMSLLFSNNGTTYTINKHLQLEVFDTSLTVAINNNLPSNPVGKFNLENLISIKGVFENVSITGASDSDSIKVHQRVDPYHSYVPYSGLDEYTFQHLESDGQMNIALHVINMNQVTFTVFSNVDTYNYTFNPFPGIGVTGFHFYQWPNSVTGIPDILIAFCTDGLAEEILEIGYITGGELAAVGFYQFSELDQCTKVKVAPINVQQSKTFAAFVHDGSGTAVEVVNINLNIAQQTIDTAQGDIFENVITYGVTKTDANVYLSVVQSDNLFGPVIAQYSRTASVSENGKLANSLNPWAAFNLTYNIFAVECTALTSNQFTCMLDTYSTNFVEYVATESATDGSLSYQNFMYKKVPNYDGRYLVITPTFFGQLANSPKDRKHALHVYKRISAGGSANVYAIRKLLEKFAPFTMMDLANSTTVLSYCTREPNAPLLFTTIGPLMLEVANTNFDASKVNIQVNGFRQAKQDIPISNIIQTETKGSSKLWIYLLILGILIAASIAYALYARSKQQTEEGEPENRESAPGSNPAYGSVGRTNTNSGDYQKAKDQEA